MAKDPKAVLTKALNLTLELDRTGRLAPRDKTTVKYLRRLLAKFNARKKWPAAGSAFTPEMPANLGKTAFSAYIYTISEARFGADFSRCKSGI
ncbi:hypothetical protein X739_05245 [Mesorhizobium sp. LNHC220B00]|nr:hypothetical protein [Mesorhizobium sp. LNHC220B00]ESY88033.1 hypothetical protein X739_05245 [Mesorhizobium sp. LNHC220B00]